MSQQSKTSLWREGLELLLGSLLMALVAEAALAEPRYIPSESMLPTLAVNDRLVIEKISRHTQQPVQRGDILVFFRPGRTLTPLAESLRSLGLTREEPLIKRVVGLPGETLAIHDGQVLINGEPLEEPYVQEAPRYELAPVRIPEDHFFMLGDNRNNSADSHVWGTLPRHQIFGQAVWRFWPPGRLGGLDSPSR